MLVIIVSLVSLLLTFSACSTNPVKQKVSCSEMNWFEKGRQDGLQGQPSNNWIMHERECAKVEKAEVQNYVDGWNYGLSLYCTEKHGFILARSGTAYQKICPERFEEDFLKGYQQGLQVFMIEKENNQITQQLEQLQSRLNSPELARPDKSRLRKSLEELNQKKTANLKTLEKYNNSSLSR